MSPADLTRWNRGGLSRFRYVDGNGVHYFDEMLQRLDAELGTGSTVASAETVQEAVDRRRAAYEAGPGSWGTEIVRAFARASHVLMEYVDAYANEGYLSTATQWEHVRRLVSLLDYRPAPPSSASTHLALLASEDGAGTLAKGFAVSHTPSDGGSPIVFETLEDVDVAAALNLIRPRNALVSPRRLTGTMVTLLGEVKNVRVAEPVVLEASDGTIASHLVTGTRATEDADGNPLTEVHVHPPLDGTFTAGTTVVHLVPADRVGLLGPASTGISGSTTLHLTEAPQGLQAGEIVFVSNGGTGYFRRVKAVRGRRLVFFDALGALSLSGATVGRTSVVEADPHSEDDYDFYAWVSGDRSALAGARVAALRTGRLGEYDVLAANYHDPTHSDHPGETELHLELVEELRGDAAVAGGPRDRLVLPPGGPGDWSADMVLETVDDVVPDSITVEAPKEAGPGDFAVLVRAGQHAHCRIESLSPDEGAKTAELVAEDAWEGYGGGPWFFADSYVYAHFREKVRVEGWDVNTTPLSGAFVTLDAVPGELTAGRRVLVHVDGDPTATVSTVKTISGGTVELAHALPSGATSGTLFLYANVVPAGHGETRDEVVLGNGDATALGQTFEVTSSTPSFVADALFPAGVRADVVVTVSGREWTQVPTLADSSATDHHYEARVTEDGSLLVVFGDGRRGRRLPTGQNNVRAVLRQGAGLAGNLPAGSLEKPVRPNPLVDSVVQPGVSSGGNDMEAVDSIRTNAPGTLLSLERAVSLTDYTHLTAQNSMVWQALAFRPPPEPGRAEAVGVVVVPAGGGALGELKTSLESYLAAHGTPGVVATVHDYRGLDLYASVEVFVDATAYDPEVVAAAVRTALWEEFSLQQRRLGDPLYRSTLLVVVENVEGVSYSTCEILEATVTAASNAPEHVSRGRDGTIRAVRPYPDQVIAWPDDPAALVVAYSEVTL